MLIMTFLIAWHLAASWYPIIFSGLHSFTKGKSESFDILAAKAVLPLEGGPEKMFHNEN